LTNLELVELPSNEQIEYVIDGKDRRVAKKINGVLTEAYLYQGDVNPIAALDNNGNVIAQYVYASQDNIPDYIITDNSTYRLITDDLGSVRLVVDIATGEIIQRLDYDVWGNILVDTNPGFQPFGFAGGLYEPNTGLTRFGARDYDPQIGRWTAQDPIGHASQDTNLYTYVYNDPVNNTDPSGLFVPIAACAVSAGIELFWQLVVDGKNLECVDWSNVATEAITGCGGGLMPGKLAKILKRLYKSWSKKGPNDIIYVTKDGVALPPGPKYKIPDEYVQNPHRSGNYGEYVNGKYKERLRIDPPTEKGKKGPDHSHYHKNGKGKHYSPNPGDPDPGFKQ